MFQFWVRDGSDNMSYPCENPISTGVVRQNNMSQKFDYENETFCVSEVVHQVIEQCNIYFSNDSAAEPLYNTTVCRSYEDYFTLKSKLLVPTMSPTGL